MPNPSLDQTVPHCLCVHPDTILAPSLAKTLEKNGMTITVADQIPNDQNWSDKTNYIVWSWNQNASIQEVSSIAKNAIEKNIKLLCLIPLDYWYDSAEKLTQGYKEITDIYAKLISSGGGLGDIRIIGYAGLWDNNIANPKLSNGYLRDKLQLGEFPASEANVVYPLKVTTAVQTIFSLWFDRGHRGKSILLSGQSITCGEILNKIDKSTIITNSPSVFWGREGELKFSEVIEKIEDTSDYIDYLKNNIRSKPAPAPKIEPKTETVVVPVREVRKIEVFEKFVPPSPADLSAKALAKAEALAKAGPPSIINSASIPKRGVSFPKKKSLIIAGLIASCMLLVINIPNLYLFTQILLARTITLESKPSSIPERYEGLAEAAELITSSVIKIPLVGQGGEHLITWGNREQNRLLTLKIQTALVQAAKHMVSASSGNPFETLLEAKHSLDELYVRLSIQNNDAIERVWVSEARKVVELIPQLIPPDKKITALLLLQNNLELRPTGGFIGAVAILSFDHGKLLTIDTRDIYDLDSNLKGLVNPPAELKTYLGESSWYFRDSNWSPDIIESASSANWFLEKEWGSSADIVIGLNLNTLKTILAATGPITLPNGTVVESNNLLATAFNHQDVPVAKPEVGKQEFLSQLIKPLIDNLIQASPEGAMRFLSALGKTADEGELTITSNQPTILSELVDFGWSGGSKTLTCSPTFPEPCVTDTLAVNEANVGINKTNFYLTRTIEHQIHLNSTTANHTHTISYTNNSPNNTWPGGSYKAFIRAIIPPNASELTIVADNQSVSPTFSSEMAGFFIEVKPQTTQRITIAYAAPLTPSYASYEFRLSKQPGVSSDPLTVSIIPPPSRSLKPLSPQLFKDASLQYSGVLNKNFIASFMLTP